MRVSPMWDMMWHKVGRRRTMWEYRRTLIFTLLGLLLASPALAAPKGEQVVARKLKRYGELDAHHAKRVAKAVSKRMGKSAGNFAPPSDPLRVAGSRDLFGRDKAPTQVDAAKLRLRLFGGASEWALRAFFAPRPGRVSACREDFSLNKQDCEALVAAAGGVSVAEARRLGGGAASRFAARSKRRAPAGKARRGSRFSRYDSGFRGDREPIARKAPAPRAPRPTAVARRPTTRRPSQFAATKRTRPAAVAPRASAAPQMSTKDAYKARREAYLARQRARLEAKKAQREAAKAAKAAPPPPEEEEPVAAPPPSATDLGLQRAAPKPKKKAEQPLDSDFLDGLLADPLGDE